MGDNLYYPATVGYDMASGMGSPNAAALAKALAPDAPAADSHRGTSSGSSSMLTGCDVSGPDFAGGGAWLAGMLSLGLALVTRRRKS